MSARRQNFVIVALHSAASSSAGTASVTSIVRMANCATLGGGSAQHSAHNHGFGGYNSPAMTMAAFRLARARQINDDWKFPRFLALVMPKDALALSMAVARYHKGYCESNAWHPQWQVACRERVRSCLCDPLTGDSKRCVVSNLFCVA